MFVLSLLASTAAVIILAVELWLFIGGYAVGGSGIVFPAWYVVLIYLGVPCVAMCGVLWAGYFLSRRRRIGARHEEPDRSGR